ncbi:DUF192 domain-containing protein [Pararhodobacter oceanensis]|uniref:DUF192 domain-containing protein n=1 Tax=Pararhodobacter oceanensis TaxID=2172121 RepID=A0A2T8HWK4_9RHOB|nr:DUF192 domain-containing protein [Pararhodobacter oceanensis]PVH29809.1 hypothetical protein DDE20_06820 [Pararhodobacter oceanensis]
MHRFGGLLTAAFILLAGAAAAESECRADRVELRGPGGKSAFTVEVAATDAERSQGLMHRESMARFAGMFFIFDHPHSAAFWMENTLIPLDMLFIDETGLVRTVHENAVPLDRTPIQGGPDILYVLEINGGMAAMLGLEAGAELRHPSIDPALAVWPCE